VIHQYKKGISRIGGNAIKQTGADGDPTINAESLTQKFEGAAQNGMVCRQ
jgi:hypothetical protein